MPKTRLTLKLNTNQTTKTVILLDIPFPEGAEKLKSHILTLSKSKLRTKKNPTRIFLPGGTELLTSEDIIHNLRDDVIFLVSIGEEYVGLKDEDGGSLGQQEKGSGSIRLMAEESTLDQQSVSQLKACATLPGMIEAIGLPDIHPGNKTPVGAAFVSKGWIHPHLIGGDIGCGMGYYRTRLKAEKLSDGAGVRRAGELLYGLEGPWRGANERKYWLTEKSLEGDKYWGVGEEWDASIGTIGSGNHFAEIQVFEDISTYVYPDEEAGISSLSLEASSTKEQQRQRKYTPPIQNGEVLLLVHSGSRGYGQHVLSLQDQHKTPSFHESDPRTGSYLALHDIACNWARLNRDLIALRFLERLEGDEWGIGFQPGDESCEERVKILKAQLGERKILDIWHNNVEKVMWPPTAPGAEASQIEREGVYIHRKGAAPVTVPPGVSNLTSKDVTLQSFLPLPGSRGTATLLLHPLLTPQNLYGATNAFSVAHGAGRAMSRAKANASICRKYKGNVEELTNAGLESTTSSKTGSSKKGQRGSGSQKGKKGGSSDIEAGWVICDDKNLVWEEAPEAYKDVELVAEELVRNGLCVVVGRARPRITYKVRRE